MFTFGLINLVAINDRVDTRMSHFFPTFLRARAYFFPSSAAIMVATTTTTTLTPSPTQPFRHILQLPFSGDRSSSSRPPGPRHQQDMPAGFWPKQALQDRWEQIRTLPILRTSLLLVATCHLQ